MDKITEIEGLEGKYLLKKMKVIREIEILEKGFLTRTEKEINIVEGSKRGRVKTRNNRKLDSVNVIEKNNSLITRKQNQKRLNDAYSLVMDVKMELSKIIDMEER